MENLKPVKTLPPFTKFCCSIGAIPTSYLVSLSYEEQLLWFCDYLKNTIIPALNQNGEAITELQNLYVQLKDYVDNYFNNLDIQQEINNKLDEMAESGELTDIIAQYLQLAGILAFNTVANMKSAENLSNGSFVRTFGKLTYNDGLGEFYKIREILNTDVIDEIHIIALTNYNNLIAELMPDVHISNLQSQINTINTELENITGKRYIFIGDSYNTTDTPEGGVPIVPWGSLVPNYIGISSNQYYNYGLSGAGWARENKTFQSMLESHYNEITNKDTITDIIVLGGVNDQSYTNSQILSAIRAFASYCRTNYPNALVTIGIISWTKSNAIRKRLREMLQFYNNAGIESNIRIIDSAYTWYHAYNLYQPDGHPNSTGSQVIAWSLANFLKNGQVRSQWYNDGDISSTGNTLGMTGNIGSYEMSLNGENVNIKFTFNSTITPDSVEIRSGSTHTLGTFNDVYAYAPSGFALPIYEGTCWMYDGVNRVYYNIAFTLIIEENKLKAQFHSYSSSGTLAFTPTLIGLPKMPIITIPTKYC